MNTEQNDTNQEESQAPVCPSQCNEETSGEKCSSCCCGDKQWNTILHASGLAGLLHGGPFGILNVGVPLIIWLIKRAENPSIDPVAKKVLNFQISWMIWNYVAVVLAIIGSCLVVPFALPVVVSIGWLVFNIIGVVKASNGESYKYPLTITFLK